MDNNTDLLYIEQFEELFVDMQTRQILTDQKSFVDSIPLYPARQILEAYRKERLLPHFDLGAFFRSHFSAGVNTQPEGDLHPATIEEHIDRLWDVLTRYPGDEKGTLIPLPKKFVVPGGRFREIFYWDSYFTMLGLQVAKRIGLIENMVDNFAHLVDRFGFIPNGNRTYFLTRSQPPFFSLMVDLLGEEKSEAVYQRYLPQLEKEYTFWMAGSEELSAGTPATGHVVRLPGGEILNRYWDSSNTARPEGFLSDLMTARAAKGEHPQIFRHLRAAAESGWDFSARWFGDGRNIGTICTCDIVPVDLNCLLLHLERTLERTYLLNGDSRRATEYGIKCSDRMSALQKYLWDEQQEAFTDYNFLTNKPVRVVNMGMVYTMVFNVATQEQAACMQRLVETRFLQPGGLLSTLVYSGEQWDAPNGWAPLQWMGYLGMMRYGFAGTAEKISRAWTNNVEYVYRNTGKITEKYNVVDTAVSARGGEYPNQDGFGWTNGVFLKFKSLQENLNK